MSQIIGAYDVSVDEDDEATLCQGPHMVAWISVDGRLYVENGYRVPFDAMRALYDLHTQLRAGERRKAMVA